MRQNNWAFLLANTLLYSVAWYLWVYWGARGFFFFPFVFSVFSILGQSWVVYVKDRCIWRQDLLLMLQIVVVGFFFEVVMQLLGSITYRDHSGLWPPFWVFILYPLFSFLINHSLKFAFNSFYLAFSVGFLGGLLTYNAGQKLGAAILPSWGWQIAIGWGLLFVIFYYLKIVTKKVVLTITDENYLKRALRVLFDGSCPICSREIRFLKKRNYFGSIHFIDLASQGYNPKENQGIEKELAMKKIHAISEEGVILTGVDVFYELYGRTKLPLLASLLKVPIFYPIFYIFYKIFAKFRLFRENLNPFGKIIRILIGLILLFFAGYLRSWVLLLFSAFTFFEAYTGWCVLFQFLGINTCPLERKK